LVGFAFNGTSEDGGHGVKIAFTRTLASKIAGRIQRMYSGKSATGGELFRGKVVRRKGDPYNVDANVTGSNAGTSDKPKFALKSYFERCVEGRVSQLVGQGGEFEGYTSVFQGDQARPHEEEEFKIRMKKMCEDRGWLWEPQAPQMPLMKVDDLAIFPAMS